MKKFLSVSAILCVMLFLLSSCGSEGAPTGLRDIKWGMTRTEIRKAETAEFVGYDENFLRYYDTDTDQPIVMYGVGTRNNVDLWYYFNSKDKLFKIEYRLVTGKLDEKSYENLKELMNDRYGEPYRSDVKNEEDDTVETSWKHGKSDITLSFRQTTAGNFYVTFLPN